MAISTHTPCPSDPRAGTLLWAMAEKACNCPQNHVISRSGMLTLPRIRKQ